MRASILLLAALFTAGCGYVGDPQPPTLNVPQSVTGLKASQIGETLVIEFQQPPNSTDGLPLRERRPPEVTVGGQPVSTSVLDDNVRLEVPASPFAGQTVEVAVRAAAGRRLSDARTVAVHIEPPLAAPTGLTARSDPRGIHLSWEAARDSTFEVFRRAAADKEAVGIGTSSTREYLDAKAVLGQPYEYSVRARIGTSESALTPPVSVTLTDTFAPAIPSGVTAISGVASIELAWERNTEPDLRGYRIYRAAKGAQPEVIADLVESPAYSDRQTQSGATYVYTVTALDAAGNESAASAAVETVAP